MTEQMLHSWEAVRTGVNGSRTGMDTTPVPYTCVPGGLWEGECVCSAPFLLIFVTSSRMSEDTGQPARPREACWPWEGNKRHFTRVRKGGSII